MSGSVAASPASAAAIVPTPTHRPCSTRSPDARPVLDGGRRSGALRRKRVPAGRRAAAGTAIASAGRATGAALRDGGDRVSEAWRRLEVTTRRRIAAVAILVGAVAVLVLVIAPLAPCWVPGGDRCPPSDDAIELVPADADAYVHMNLDPDTDQAEVAGPVTEKLPELTTQAAGLLALATDRVIDYRRDIAPWSGGEVALSVDAGLTSVDRVLLIEVADTEGAEAFVDSYLRDGVTETDVEGITVKTDRAGTSAAIAGGFLILGPEDGVNATVERARGTGEGGSLAGDDAYERVEESLPDDRIVDAWIAPALADTLFSGPRAQFGTFNTFVNADRDGGRRRRGQLRRGDARRHDPQRPGPRGAGDRARLLRQPAGLRADARGRDRRRRARIPGDRQPGRERRGLDRARGRHRTGPVQRARGLQPAARQEGRGGPAGRAAADARRRDGADRRAAAEAGRGAEAERGPRGAGAGDDAVPGDAGDRGRRRHGPDGPGGAAGTDRRRASIPTRPARHPSSRPPRSPASRPTACRSARSSISPTPAGRTSSSSAPARSPSSGRAPTPTASPTSASTRRRPSRSRTSSRCSST